MSDLVEQLGNTPIIILYDKFSDLNLLYFFIH